MKYCPQCHASVEFVATQLPSCSRCGWSGDYTKLLDYDALPDKCTQDKNLKLDSPPRGCNPVREARYLTHCNNLAHIIAHSGSMPSLSM